MIPNILPMNCRLFSSFEMKLISKRSNHLSLYKPSYAGKEFSFWKDTRYIRNREKRAYIVSIDQFAKAFEIINHKPSSPILPIFMVSYYGPYRLTRPFNFYMNLRDFFTLLPLSVPVEIMFRTNMV